jgi:hypothetical protein
MSPAMYFIRFRSKGKCLQQSSTFNTQVIKIVFILCVQMIYVKFNGDFHL